MKLLILQIIVLNNFSNLSINNQNQFLTTIFFAYTITNICQNVRNYLSILTIKV